MPDLQNTGSMLDAAERAAMAGDLAAADELLANAARIQEAELGALHPDLANTLNNRAILAERTGRLDDAERFYRRAAAIAAASLPADHPMVVASRQNLEDFCHARNLPVDAPAAMAIEPHELGLHSFAAEDAGTAETAAPSHAGDAWAEAAAEPAMALADHDTQAVDAEVRLRPAAPPSAVATSSVPLTQTQQEPQRTAAAPPLRTSSSLGWLVGGGVALAVVALLMLRPWSSTDTAPADPAAAAVPAPTAPAAAPAEPAPSTAAPLPAAPADKTDDRQAAIAGAPAAPAAAPPATSTAATGAAAASGPLAVAELCRTLSTSGGRWQCDAAGDDVASGPLVFYTRVRASQDGAVVHRWYRGDDLVKTVRLRTRANATEGYRTYSRHTADSPGNWRVEVRSAAGDLLHERRFVVR